MIKCPFCGTTSGITSIFNFNLDEASTLSMLVLLIIFTEIALRTMVILSIKKLSSRMVTGIIITDVIYHLLLVIITSIYVIMFLLNNF